MYSQVHDLNCDRDYTQNIFLEILFRPNRSSYVSPMDDPFSIANTCFRRADHARWHRHLSKRHILRSQLGFGDVAPSRPKACHGCHHYHGIAYGYSKETRSVLVCAFHPYGWHEDSCPDWQEAHV